MKFSHPNRRTVISVAAALSLGVVSIAGAGVASAHRNATVEFDGVTLPVSGFMVTVADALEAANVTPGEHDEVAPEPSERLSNGSTVVVRRAHPYSIDDNGDSRTVWSTAKSVEDFVESLSGGVTLAANRSAERTEVPLFGQQGTVTIQVDGQKKTVEADANDTTQSIMEKAQLTLSPIDRVTMHNVDGQLGFVVQRITRGNKVTTEAIPAPVEERDDDSIYEGETSVVQEGSEGKIVTTTYVETVDGKTTVEKQISQERTEPVARIIANGTKPKPEPTRSRRGGNSGGNGGGSQSHEAPAPASGDVWAALAQCESGGNPSTNTGNGFYGMYQFSLPTWRAVGGSGLPSEASAAEQTMRAQILQQRAGWGQWPACSARLGLY